MAASSTEISNLAISHLGIGKTIADIETENSQEAKACNAFYSTVLDMTLRACDWGFARKTKALSLITTNPTPEWGYSYAYPNECLNFRKILSGVRNETRQSRISFMLYNGESSTVVYTDMGDAFGVYTARVTNPVLYPPDFTMAFSFLLAGHIAPRIGGSQNIKMGDRAFQLYERHIVMAYGHQANEEQQDEQPESEFIRGR